MLYIIVQSYIYLFSLQYMRNGDCFIIVYSITDRLSFEEAQSIFEFTKRIRDRDMPVVSGVNAFCL